MTVLMGAAASAPGGEPGRASLVLSHQQAEPGSRIAAAIRLTAIPGWHWYWRNPGDSGMPPTLTWRLPPGVMAGAVRWPAPDRLVADGAVTYALTEGTLLVPISLPATAAGTLTIALDLDWMACADTCVPLRHSVSATLAVGPSRPDPVAAALIAAAELRAPAPLPATAVIGPGPVIRLAGLGPAWFAADEDGWHAHAEPAPASPSGALAIPLRPGVRPPERLRGILRSASAAYLVDVPYPRSSP